MARVPVGVWVRAPFSVFVCMCIRLCARARGALGGCTARWRNAGAAMTGDTLRAWRVACARVRLCPGGKMGRVGESRPLSPTAPAARHSL